MPLEQDHNCFLKHWLIGLGADFIAHYKIESRTLTSLSHFIWYPNFGVFHMPENVSMPPVRKIEFGTKIKIFHSDCHLMDWFDTFFGSIWMVLCSLQTDWGVFPLHTSLSQGPLLWHFCLLTIRFRFAGSSNEWAR